MPHGRRIGDGAGGARGGRGREHPPASAVAEDPRGGEEAEGGSGVEDGPSLSSRLAERRKWGERERSRGWAEAEEVEERRRRRRTTAAARGRPI
jgi:hypothetical protein